MKCWHKRSKGHLLTTKRPNSTVVFLRFSLKCLSSTQIFIFVLQELESQLESTQTRLGSERDSLRTRLEHMEAELSAKLQRAEAEARRLEGILGDHEKGLGSAQSRIDSLQGSNSRLLGDLELAQKEGRESASQASSFKVSFSLSFPSSNWPQVVLSRNGTESGFRLFPLEPGLHFPKLEIRQDIKKVFIHEGNA